MTAASLPTVRMLHTSDVHVSDDGSALDSLAAVASAALSDQVDIVLVAGDLFDSSRVSDAAVDRTIGELSRLTMPVVVIPGNHDCVDERSIYHRVDLGRAGSHVVFAGDPAGQTLPFEDLSLVIWARGIQHHDPSHKPLAGCAPADPARWNVVLTHGHFVPNGQASDRSSVITQEEIGGLGCHYLALGHWHRYVDVSEGAVAAYYSGAPWDFFGGGGSVNLVTLDPTAGVTVERRALSASTVSSDSTHR